MSRDYVYVYEFIIHPFITLVVQAGFGPEEIAKFIEGKLTKKFFLPDNKDIFINLSSIDSFKLLSKELKDDR